MWLLAGIFLIILSHYISFGWNKRKALKFANFDAIFKVTRQKLFPRSYVPLVFKIIILVLVVFSASGLGIWYDGYSSDNDYILAIDASGSMLADDYEPNRLEAAKNAAKGFIDALNFDVNVGVISFAGTPFLVQSLINDKANIRDAVGAIEPINIGGTATGDALILAINAFKVSDSGLKGRSIILLTDGQSNVGIDLEDAIDYAVSNGVVINTLGVGTEEGGSFVYGEVTSQLDPSTLEKLADETGGEFYLVENENELNQAYSSILSDSRSRVFLDARNYLLLLVFILLLVETILANTRYKTII